VVPVSDLPVATLSNRVVGVTLRFAKREWTCLLGNIDLKHPESTREFATLSIWRDEGWFHLARYFDFDWDECGSDRLAASLGLPTAEVFPIRYDLSGLAVGHPEVIEGRIDAEPEVRLTKNQRMALIFRD
jgi:hypothetical protein